MSNKRKWLAKLAGIFIIILPPSPFTTVNASADIESPTSSAFISGNIDGHLKEFFTCLKESKIAIVSAHRAGAYPAYPENALESLQRIAGLGPLMAEIDVMTSQDGVLFLHHDSTLERTTSAKGNVSETNWAELATLQLRDSEGKLTTYHPPELAEVLEWSRGNIVLQLDAKPPTQILQVAELVENLQAMGRVIFIVYSLADASLLSSHYPQAIFSLGVENEDKLQEIVAAKLDLQNLQALVGAEHSQRDYTSLLNTAAIVVAGSYGSEQSIDNISSTLDNEQLRQVLRQAMARGIQVMISNEPVNLLASLSRDKTYLHKLRECALPR